MIPVGLRVSCNAFDVGALSAFFYYPYILMQIPVGALFDRFNIRVLLALSAFLCGVACILFTEVHSLFIAQVCRMLMGFGASFAFVGALKIASLWFPSKFGFLSGATQAIGVLGAAFGVGPVSIFIMKFGWKDVFLVLGFIFILLSLLIVLITQSYKKNFFNNVKVKKLSLLSSFVCVIKNSQIWINGIMTGFLYAPTAVFAELWGSSYIHSVYGLKTGIADTSISMIFIGWGVGAPLFGWFSDYIKRRKPILISSIFLSMFFLSYVLYASSLSVFEIYVLLFFYGFCNIGASVSYIVANEISDFAPATAISFTNMSSVLIGAFLQPVIGWLLIFHWNHIMRDGIPFYSRHDFRFAMFALPLCFVISLVAVLFLKESYRTKATV